MTTTTVICPSCRAALRSSKPLPASKAVRCPDCGHRFQTPPAADSGIQTPFPAFPPPVPGRSRPAETPKGQARGNRSNIPLVAAICALCFLIGAGIAVAVWLSIREKPRPAVVETEPEKPKQVAEEKPKKVVETKPKPSEGQKQPDEETTRLREEARDLKKKLQFASLMSDAQTALNNKQYKEAEKQFFEALKLFPEDPKAQAGLKLTLESAAAKGVAAQQANEKKEKEQEAYKRLMAVGKEKMMAKEYAAAVTSFQEALALLPGDAAASTARDEAQKALEGDKAQQEALTKYKAHLEAGRKFVFAMRYSDAIPEFQAAGQVIPGDPTATAELRQAEQLLNDLKKQELQREAMSAFQQEVSTAQNALMSRQTSVALAAIERARKIAPNHPAIQVLQKQVKQQQAEIAQARNDFKQLVAQAQAALQTRQYAQAMTLYQQANQMSPGDPDVRRGMQLLQKLQAAQYDYQRAMTQANVALQQNQFSQAAQAFTTALLAVPMDQAALAGLNQARKGLAMIELAIKEAEQARLQQQWPIAIVKIERALQFLPGDPTLTAKLMDARFRLALDKGNAAMQTRQFQAAIVSFQEALRLKPGDFGASLGLQQAKIGASSPR